MGNFWRLTSAWIWLKLVTEGPFKISIFDNTGFPRMVQIQMFGDQCWPHLWIYCQLIMMSYIALTQQVQIYQNMSNPLGRLGFWIFCCIVLQLIALQTSSQASGYASPKLCPLNYWLTYLLTGVKCRATSVAKNGDRERMDGKLNSRRKILDVLSDEGDPTLR